MATSATFPRQKSSYDILTPMCQIQDTKTVCMIHIYLLPWPANKTDQRRLLIVRIESKLPVSPEVKRYEYTRYAVITEGHDLSPLHTEFRYSYQMLTSLSIDIKLPLRVHKLILSRQLELFHMHKDLISNAKQLYHWFIRYANLKDNKDIFDMYRSPSTLSIWY